ncbi:hypothetical protein [Larkinella soli]|uniref:hypothetical protein n=1 Tax=Larkinella soli TaxID=1770527 RepID=UPI000FFB45A3|nr:hypothetical protein [Larkinella soli]
MKKLTLKALSLIFSGISLPLGFACRQEGQKTNESFSKEDTIQVIQTALDDPALDSIFRLAYPGKAMKLVSNKIIKPDYEIIYKGRQVLIVDYDSTLYNPTSFPTPPKFYGSVTFFKKVSNKEIIIYLLFRSISQTVDFIMVESDGRWKVKSRSFGKI